MVSHRFRLLVVDDNPAGRDCVAQALQRKDVDVLSSERPEQALRYVDKKVALVISQLQVSGTNGLDLMQSWKRHNPSTSFVIVGPRDDIPSAISAVKLGADDYLPKPVDPDRLRLGIDRCLQRRDLPPRRPSLPLEGIIGQSPAIRAALERVERAAAADSTVLITGESGTGKELVARAIHQLSGRRTGPYIAFNIAAVPDSLLESELFGHVAGAFTGAERARVGRFSAAEPGTIFVDEVGDVPLHVQAKLLRVLENKRVSPVGANNERPLDVRVIAATSRNLHQAVKEGKFRLDLYYRLNVIHVHLPPLRQRRGDVRLLVEHFLDEFSRRYSRPRLTADVHLIRHLETRYWPGNVRQLRNVMESMAVLARNDRLTLDDVPAWCRADLRLPMHRIKIPTGTKLADLQRAAISQALDQFGGNTTQAAASLGLSVRTLERTLRSWQLARRGVPSTKWRTGHTRRIPMPK